MYLFFLLSDIIYAGQVLKQEDVLSKNSIHNLSTLYVVRKFTNKKQVDIKGKELLRFLWLLHQEMSKYVSMFLLCCVSVYDYGIIVHTNLVQKLLDNEFSQISI